MAAKKSNTDQNIVNHVLASTGFIFPRTEDELESFNKLHSDDYELKGYFGDPNKLIEESESSTCNQLHNFKNKVPRSTYFKRVVLAAEITAQLYNEVTFGHVKLQKLMFLCENIYGMNINYHYFKKAAGPYDNKFMHSIDNEFKRQKWFNVQKEQTGTMVKYLYEPLEKFKGHEIYFDRYFTDSKGKIQWFIDTFRKAKTRQVELVATLYACWMEIIDNNQIISDDQLKFLLYSWSNTKKKFSEKSVQSAVNWMRENNVFPKRNKG
ncbi:MAG: hypothetical protein K9H15_05065 [Bacteroidales bacterium]|nr:hypothetical protein [Bacteroidales bacterium]